jgi:hypothetical protein
MVDEESRSRTTVRRHKEHTWYYCPGIPERYIGFQSFAWLQISPSRFIPNMIRIADIKQKRPSAREYAKLSYCSVDC